MGKQIFKKHKKKTPIQIPALHLLSGSPEIPKQIDSSLFRTAYTTATFRKVFAYKFIFILLTEFRCHPLKPKFGWQANVRSSLSHLFSADDVTIHTRWAQFKFQKRIHSPLSNSSKVEDIFISTFCTEDW